VAKPEIHAANSVKRWGGRPEDYLPIHDEMDSSKAAHASMRHRALYHHAFGIYVMERIFGHHIVNSDRKSVSVRDIAEQHVLEDLGFIPSLDQYLLAMEEQPWMSGIRRLKFQVVD
jgi:hypothetical protein